jgi:hypothetical protein
MKKLLTALALLTLALPAHAQLGYNNPYSYGQGYQQPQVYVPNNPYLQTNQVPVRGYTNSYGTYVQPYTRSSPDGNIYNNRSRRNSWEMPIY